MKPYYQDEWVTIYHGDCREILPTLEKVDAAITSPPYNITTGKGGAWQVDDWYDDSLDEGEYQLRQVEVLDLLRDCVKWVCYNHKIRQRGNIAIHPMAWLLRTKWFLFQEIIWNRGSTHNHTGNYYWPIDERIFILTGDEKPRVVERNHTTICF